MNRPRAGLDDGTHHLGFTISADSVREIRLSIGPIPTRARTIRERIEQAMVRPDDTDIPTQYAAQRILDHLTHRWLSRGAIVRTSHGRYLLAEQAPTRKRP